MGYTTDFAGEFKLNKKLDKETSDLLSGLANTRRMARKVAEKYGVDGEFYVDGKGFLGQEDDTTIIDHNRPPKTQPSLWLQWVLSEDGSAIIWDGGEKFYEYVAWIKYLIEKILSPRGYSLTGEVEWQDNYDMGIISIVNNKVTVKEAVISYKERE